MALANPFLADKKTTDNQPVFPLKQGSIGSETSHSFVY
jgi:hypothetical protein